jgi:hypothetical protein
MCTGPFCKINPNVKVNSVGQECPTHTCNCNINTKDNFQPRVNSVGQECPIHTCNCNIKCKGNFNTKVKGVGQECPTHTSYLTHTNCLTSLLLD